MAQLKAKTLDTEKFPIDPTNQEASNKNSKPADEISTAV
jgi:hypothetical protein